MTTPNGSGVINRGTDYADGSQVTSSNINEHVDNAVFNDDAVDDITIGLNSDTPKALFVKNQGIDTAQLKDNAVTTVKITDANVTKAKIENIDNLKVLGNTSGSASAPQEVTINDTDNMSDASDTTIATSESIKAYVDTTAAPTVGFSPTTYTGGESVTFPNGLIMKWGEKTVSGDSVGTVTFIDAFPNECIQAQATLGQSGFTQNDAGCGVDTLTTTTLRLINGHGTSKLVRWFAIGR